MPRETTVISVRGRDRNALLADPAFVYVGRAVFGGAGPNWRDSPWGNPFRVGMKRQLAINLLGADVDSRVRSDRLDTPRLAVLFYADWLETRPELIARLPELVGRTLGCWCGDWAPGGPHLHCHAVHLAGRANELARTARGPQELLAP